MTPIATIDLWADEHTRRHCRLVVSDDGCEVEIRSDGERMLTAWYPSLAEAFESAVERQPSTAVGGPQVAA